jgi:hypothetical protein
LNDQRGKETPLTVAQGGIHERLGMTQDAMEQARSGNVRSMLRKSRKEGERETHRKTLRQKSAQQRRRGHPECPKENWGGIHGMTCQAKFVVSKKTKNLLKKGEVRHRCRSRKRTRIKRDKAPCFLEHGVGYEVPDTDNLCFKEEPLVNESLVGKHDLVHCSSACRDSDDCMHLGAEVAVMG